jgi:pimeloyl-ACP methyl ester carboxylesterase
MSSLILIPGLLCNQILWADQIAALSSIARITVPDLTSAETVSAMASSVLEAAPERFFVAGFSLGSWVALEIMGLAAERVERLALLSATRGGLTPVAASATRHAIQTISQGNFDAYVQAAYPSYFSPTRASDRSLQQRFTEMAYAVGPAAGLRQMRALLAIESAFPSLENIHCPTLIVGGREDGRTPPAAHEALAKEIPGSELVLIEDAAHFTPMEQPEQVNAALKHWLDRAV